MKSEMVFLTAVLGIAGIHMLFSLVNFLAKFKRPTQGMNKAKVRDDWYVFFDKSALLGDDLVISEKTEVVDNSSADIAPAYSDTCQPEKAYAY